MATHILVVDDETAIADLVEVYLKNEGFTIHKFYNASDALACVRTTRLNLAVLDVMLPDMDGFTLCQRIREDHLFPIIMLTAKVEDMDKIMGLTLGADDYITKPFNILELKARIRALLRRAGIAAAQPGAQSSAHILEHGGVTLDTEKRTAYKHGRSIDLTAREFDLAELFLRSPGRVFSRDSLLDLVWGYDYQGDARTVDVHIRRLREKLEDNPASPSLIITKWGVGYYLAE